VLGPGDRVHFEWRNRYAGDHADLDEVVEAIPTAHPAVSPQGERENGDVG
jgi:hypothetical protein